MITPTEALILSLLVARPIGAFGSELVSSSDGKLKRGSVYTLLTRLEAGGLVKSEQVPPSEGNSIPRTRYRVTGAGVRARQDFADWTGLSAARV